MFYIDKLISPSFDVVIKLMPNGDKILIMLADSNNLRPKSVIKQ